MFTWDSTAISFDQTCWTYDGYNGCAEPKPPPIISDRGSGPTNGIRPQEPGYRDYYEDSLRESRIARIKRMDDEVIDFIVTIITKGLI